jgi:hypothetical protein
LLIVLAFAGDSTMTTLCEMEQPYLFSHLLLIMRSRNQADPVSWLAFQHSGELEFEQNGHDDRQ